MLDKKHFILFLLSFVYRTTFGQFVKEFSKMTHIYKDWQSRGSCDTLYYTDKVNPDVLTKAISMISSKETFPLHDLYAGSETEPLVITPAEKSYVLSELEKLREFKWPATMFPKSKRISNTDIDKVLHVTEKFSEEKYHSCSLIYSFSKPIYLRNGTVCLSIDQEIFDHSDSRIIIEFLCTIDGEWDRYTEVFTQFGKAGSPSKNTVDTLVSSIIRSQTLGIPPRPGLQPEQLPEFGMRVFSAFQSQQDNPFPRLYPTLDQRILIAKQLNLPTRKKSPEMLQYDHALAILNFNYRCLNILDTAKALKIDWATAAYSGTTNYEVATPFTGINGKRITVSGANVEFVANNRRFRIRIEGIYLLDDNWTTTAINGLTEISKQ